MIVINNISEIEKYLISIDKNTTADKAIDNFKCYIFKENDNLEDVVFNCIVPFGASDLYNLHFVDDDLFQIDLDKSTHIADAYCFKAKSFIFNKRVGLEKLYSINTIIVNDDCEINRCSIQNGTIIVKKTLICENLNADGFSAKDLYFDSEVIHKYIKKCPMFRAFLVFPVGIEPTIDP